MARRNDFFTLQSLGTFGGATAATFAIANGIQSAFGFNPQWLALAVAEVVCIGTVLVTRNGESAAADGGGRLPQRLVGAGINGFLVFSSASGVTQVGARMVAAEAATVAAAPEPPAPRTFWTPWP